MIAYKKLVPGADVRLRGVAEARHHRLHRRTSPRRSRRTPILIVSSCGAATTWRSTSRRCATACSTDAKFASTIAFGVAPHAIGKDHPEGVIAGVHSNYYFTYPGRESLADQQDLRREATSSAGTSIRTSSRTAPITRSTVQGCDREGEQAGRRLAGRGRHHQPARRHVFRDAGGLSLHPARQPPGLQGRGDGIHQERARVPVPDPRSEAG